MDITIPIIVIFAVAIDIAYLLGYHNGNKNKE